MSVRDYAILYTGARRSSGGAGAGTGMLVGGGSSVLDAPPHALSGGEHSGVASDAQIATGTPVAGQVPISNGDGTRTWSDVAAGLEEINDGTVAVTPVVTVSVPPGGVEDLGGDEARLHFLTDRLGEQAALVTVDDAGSSLELDLATANVFDVTLTDDLVLTLANPPAGGVAGEWAIILRQGTGAPHTVSWPLEIDWQDRSTGLGGGSAPVLYTTVNAQDVVVIRTLDGGASYGGEHESEVPEVPVASGLLPVDIGVATYDDAGDDVEVTVATVWGFDGADGYYDSAGAVSGEEAILYWDPDLASYTLVPFEF